MTWLEHDREVIHHPQPTVNSCWWACTAMLMRYHGQTLHGRPYECSGLRYKLFRELSGDEGRGLEHLQIARPFGWYANRGLTTRWRDEEQYFSGLTFSNGFLHPSHWWRLGCPHDRHHVMLWTRLTPLRPADRLGFGGTSGVTSSGGFTDAGAENAQRWWNALEEKPLLVTQPRGRSFHALIARGIRRRSNQGVEAAEVILQDPALRGPHPTFRSLQMVMRHTYLVLTM